MNLYISEEISNHRLIVDRQLDTKNEMYMIYIIKLTHKQYNYILLGLTYAISS